MARSGRTKGSNDLGDLARLSELATTLAGAWGARARASTTIGRERAVLRLFGVHGVDRAGRPLAGEVVDRYLAGGPRRLGGGIALAFAMALVEYDLGPQELALDVASGAVDLGLEAELLLEPDRRAVAEEEARRLIAAAFDRIDANRTARRELVDVLGDPPRPWVGTTLLSPSVGDAVREAMTLVRDGIDVVRVEVPVGRELASRLSEAGIEVPGWQPRERGRPAGSSPADAPDDAASTPSGSQRALGDLRHALDRAAAERRSYVRLATAAPALGTPEQAVVAAFERVDLVEADPMAEIVAGRVDPDRALADHAFAHRLHRRGGSLVVVGAGPLAVGPDLAAGIPSDAATRAGRALALQLVGVALARGDGLPVEQIVVGALPDWLTDERAPTARGVAEVVLRLALFDGHPLAFDEPATVPDRAAVWPFILAGVLAAARVGAVVLRRPTEPSMQPVVRETRAAAAVAAEVAASLRPAELDGAARDHARATVTAASATLERLGEIGWRAVIGDPPGGVIRLGADAVAERSEPFDPLALEPGARI